VGVCARRFQTLASQQNESGVICESGRGIVSKGKYSVELFKEGGEGAGQEEIIDRHDNLTIAEPSIAAGCPKIRADWSCCATALAFWRGAIDRRRCREGASTPALRNGLT
jgi:hypothetical protein